MTPETHQYPSPRRRRWPGFLVVAVVIGIAGVAGYRTILTTRIQAQLQLIRQAGYPATSAELDRWHAMVPIQENAALKIMNAAELLSTNAPRIDALMWPERGAALTPEQREKFELALANNSEALRSLHQGVGLPHSRYLVDFSRGLATLLPHLAKVKALTQWLRAEAVLASEQGKPDLAVRSIKDSLSLARSLDTEPVLISQLVRLACLHITVSSLERVLTQQVLGNDQLQELAAALAKAEDQNQKAFTRALIGERCLGSFAFTMPFREFVHASENGSSDEQMILYQGLSLIGIRDLDFLFYLRTMADWIKVNEAPFPENLAKAKQSGDRIQTELSGNRLYVLSKMVLPGLAGLTEKMAEGNARLRCAHVAILVERYRLQNGGQLPGNLNRLVPEVISRISNDPCSGDRLRYKPLPKGYVIYSAGKDGQDNGGVAPAKKPGADAAYDLTFTVER